MSKKFLAVCKCGCTKFVIAHSFPDTTYELHVKCFQCGEEFGRLSSFELKAKENVND